MSRSRSGWQVDGRGRSYFADEYGRALAVRPADHERRSPAMSVSTYAEVVEGRYRPFPKAPYTHPPRTHPAYEFQSLTDHNKPYFGPGSMHSGRGDVDFPASKHSVAGISRDGISTDVYRDAKADWGQGGPTTSAYDRQHFEYKSQEEVAGKIGQSYKAWNKERRDKHIPVTQEIHQEGSIRAREAYEAAKSVADRREKYAADYIGYHQRRYLPGHKKAIEHWRNSENNYADQMRYHDGREPIQAMIDRGRREKAERLALEAERRAHGRR